MLYGWVTLFVVLFVVFFFYYNSFVKLRQSVRNAWSGIDVWLKKRADLIPNLVSAVKGAMKHERELLENITKTRVALLHARGDVKKSASADGALESDLKTLFAVAEKYPKIRSNENFLSLQKELGETEDEIASARRIYNSNVKDYNTKVVSFPGILFARIFGFHEVDYFKATKKEKENVLVDF